MTGIEIAIITGVSILLETITESAHAPKIDHSKTTICNSSDTECVAKQHMPLASQPVIYTRRHMLDDS